MALQVSAIGLLLFLMVGGLSSSLDQKSGPAAVTPLWELSVGHYEKTISRVTGLPKFCIYGEISSDFQQKQCTKFWSELLIALVLALIPFAGVGLLCYLMWNEFNRFYARMAEKTEEGMPKFEGTATDPVTAPEDVFSRFYCVRPVTVELASGEQVKIYLSPLQEVSPGQIVRGFEAGSYFGAPRVIGLVKPK